MLDEIHNHLVFVLTEKLGWHDATNPEMALGSGHVVIRFEIRGQRMVYRVARHGLQQHKRTMLAYRHVGGLGIIPEKIYHDGKCVIERHADGVALTAQVSDGVLVQLAQRLSQLHAIGAHGFGPLDFDLQGSFADAQDYYKERSTIEFDRSEMDLTEAQESFLTANLEQVLKPPTALLTAPVRLGHGDLWRNNILITHDSFRIVDWDRIGAYPIERELAFLWELGLSAHQFTLFYEHYAQASALNPVLLAWFAKRRVLGDVGLPLAKKLQKLQKIDELANE